MSPVRTATTVIDPTRSDGDRFEGLCDATSAAMARLRVPGVAIGVQVGGSQYVAGLGITRVDSPESVTPDTPFQIASISKTMTGTALMRLVEAGQADLAAPVRRYLPELQLADDDVAARVTLRDILAHRGGWLGDFFPNTGSGDDALAQAVALLPSVPQVSPLGALFSYNNSGFYVAGRVLERLHRASYEDVMRRELFGPLGMSSTAFGSQVEPTAGYAFGHNMIEDELVVANPWALSRASNPVGGVVTSVRDLLKYARLHLGGGVSDDGTRVLAETSVARMQEPRGDAGDTGDFVGTTWRMSDIAGERTVGHGGSSHGQRSSFTMVPRRRFAVVVMTNAARGVELHNVISAFALRDFLGLESPPPIYAAKSTSELAEYVGRYEARLNRVELSGAERGLVMQVTPRGGFPYEDSPPLPAPPPVRLGFTATDNALALDPPFEKNPVHFVRGADGRIEWLRFGGRLTRRV